MDKVSKHMIARAMVNNLDNHISLRLKDFIVMNRYNLKIVDKNQWERYLKFNYNRLKTFVDYKAIVNEIDKTIIFYNKNYEQTKPYVIKCPRKIPCFYKEFKKHKEEVKHNTSINKIKYLK